MILSDDQIRRMEIDALKRYLRRRLGGYTVAIKNILPDNLLYRGVRWQERPSTTDQLLYPPIGTASLGRVNRAGMSMFYCSRAAAAVFFELHATQGDLIALSEWAITDPLWMHNLGFHQEALQKLGAPTITMRPQLNDPIPNETGRNARLRRELSLAFTEDIRTGTEYRYKQSIGHCHVVCGATITVRIRSHSDCRATVVGLVCGVPGR